MFGLGAVLSRLDETKLFADGKEAKPRSRSDEKVPRGRLRYALKVSEGGGETEDLREVGVETLPGNQR